MKKVLIDSALIRTWIIQNGYSTSGFARKCGLSTNALFKLFRDSPVSVQYTTAQKIANGIGVPAKLLEVEK